MFSLCDVCRTVNILEKKNNNHNLVVLKHIRRLSGSVPTDRSKAVPLMYTSSLFVSRWGSFVASVLSLCVPLFCHYLSLSVHHENMPI